MMDKISQDDWRKHVDGKLQECAREWEAAHFRWQQARAIGDAEATVTAFEEEALYLRAERLANNDMSLSESQWKSHWDTDYVAEARQQMRPPKKSASLMERLELAKSVLS